MSKKLILASSELAQWHELVCAAEADYGCHLDETMQSYLVFTLMRFMKKQDLATQALALDYLQTHGLPNKMKQEQLRDIGDQCLLVSGLYPKQAAKKLVRVSYYVDLGRSAYHHLSDCVSDCAQQSIAELYAQLANTFIVLMDLLQTIRQYNAPAMQTIAAMELWSDTGSKFAYNQLSSNALPLHESLTQQRNH